MQNFYRSLPLETQELLGEPDLALYGILRGGIWLAARAGDVVDIGVELVHNPVDTLRNAYQSVKSAVHAAVDGLAAAECICVDPVAFRLSLNQHVESVVRANGLSEAGMIAYVASLEQVLSEDVLRYDEELNRYVYPAGLTAFLNQTQCDKNNLDAVQTLFATESGLRSTEETLQEAARSFTEHESEHLVTFQHELENSVDLAKRFWGDNEVERSK
jgi:hypothetical protein